MGSPFLIDWLLIEKSMILREIEKDDIIFLLVAFLGLLFYNYAIRARPDPYHHVWFEKPQDVSENNDAQETRNIGRKVEDGKYGLVALWGSQSGTAEGLAKILVKDCRAYGLRGLAADMQDFEPETLANISRSTIVIFLASTYGEGDPSDNATQFFTWLETNKTVNLSDLRYAAFGLGNKNYKYYNRVIDVIDSALAKAGAQALMPCGRADDSEGGTREDFLRWEQSLFAMFEARLGLEPRATRYEPELVITKLGDEQIQTINAGLPVERVKSAKSRDMSATKPLNIEAAEMIGQAPDGTACLHIELDIHDTPELKYKTGDHLAVWPSNPIEEVERLVRVLGLKAELSNVISISPCDKTEYVRIPTPTKIYALFEYYLEICAAVPRNVASALVEFAPDEVSKSKLRAIITNGDLYHNFSQQNYMNLGRLLEEVSSPTTSWSTIPLSFILEVLSPLSPRYYSISSSSIVSPRRISITVASNSSWQSDTRLNPGVATNYLLAKTQSEGLATLKYNLTGPEKCFEHQQKRVHGFIRKSKFRPPIMPTTPMILVAAGSGIAPFRGFIMERARLAAIGRPVGKTVLFFGCRSPDHVLYAEELAKAAEKMDLEIVQAFSRTAKNEKGGKCYVQDKIMEREAEVIKLLKEEDASLYICGSAVMARDVSRVLGECTKVRMGWSEEALQEWSRELKKTRRWQEDVW